MRINKKLSLQFIAVSLLSIFLLGVLLYVSAKRILRNEIINKLHLVVEGRESMISHLLEMQLANLQYLAQGTSIIKYTKQMVNTDGLYSKQERRNALRKLKKYLTKFGNFHGGPGFKGGTYADIMIADLKGHMWIGVYGPDEGGNEYSTEWFQKGSRGLYLGDISYNPTMGQTTQISAMPIKDIHGKIIGVIQLEVNILSLDHIMKQGQGLGKTGETYIVSKDKILLTRSRKMQDYGDKLLVDTPIVKKAERLKNDVSMSGYRNYLGDTVIGSAHPLGVSHQHRNSEYGRLIKNLGWYLVGEIEESEAYIPISRFEDYILYTGLVLIIFAILISIYISRSISKPIEELREATHMAGTGNLITVKSVKSDDEIGDLARSFNMMVEDLQRTTVSVRFVDSIINSMINPLFVLSSNCLIQRANSAAEKLLGYGLKELKGTSIMELFPADFSLSGLMIKHDIMNKEGILIGKNGSVIPVIFSSTIMWDENSRVQAIVCVAQDITNRKKEEKLLQTAKDELERIVSDRTSELVESNIDLKREITERKLSTLALRESEEKFKAIINQASDSILLVEIQDGREPVIIDANLAACEMHGYSLDEMIGRPLSIFDSQSSEELTGERLKQLLSGEKLSFDGEHQRKNGTVFPVEATLHVIHIKGKSLLMVIDRDITMRKEAEEERIKMHARLQRSQKMEAIGTLAGGIAHDFNNILSVIIGSTNLAIKKIPAKNAVNKYLNQILKAGFRAGDLVNQILTLSSQGELKLVPVNMIPVIHEIIKFIEPTLPGNVSIEKNINIKNDIFMGNSSQLYQVLMNLCTNAIHAMHETGGILALSADEIQLDSGFAGSHPELETGKYFVIGIGDTGHGMDKETIDRIFDPFFTTKDREKGTGLGLAVTHGIVDNHGGAITVKSEPGSGSEFKVFLPMIEGDIIQDGRESNEIPGGDECIMFIDDEKTLVEIGTELLESLGYEVVAFSRSSDALERFKSDPDKFAVIITDLNMPNLTGVDLAREILKIQPGKPVILCTGFSDKITPRNARSMGICEFIYKPIMLDDLAETIRRAIENVK